VAGLVRIVVKFSEFLDAFYYIRKRRSTPDIRLLVIDKGLIVLGMEVFWS
jgi:hypothetical protein